MKRLASVVTAATIVTATIASPAWGFALNLDYVGHVKDQPSADVGFSVDRTPNGSRKVHGFLVTHVPYTCADAPSGTTAGWRFKPRMAIRSDRRFEGRGDWVDLPLDPVGTVEGKLRKNGVAVGTFKLRGELAGPGTHCRTGLLDWRATKQAQQN